LAEGAKAVLNGRRVRRDLRKVMESKRAANSVAESETHQNRENDASGMTGNDRVG
jgi:hypothetical protein